RRVHCREEPDGEDGHNSVGVACISGSCGGVDAPMTRSRASARAAGQRFESDIVGYLNTHIDDRIERRRLNGKSDRGDVTGLKVHGLRTVIECKDHSGKYQIK